jgi:uncharacterized membrane protein (DUF485 family)
MLEAHQELVEEYKANEKVIDKSRVGIIILMVVIIGIVVGMKAIQTTASLQLNICATSVVLLLLTWHFWGFYPRRARYEKSANIVLRGLQIERENPFFKDYLKKFNTLRKILEMVIFDLFLIYFFSVSFTQLIKAISPEAIVKLRPITPISTAFISFSLVWAYYRAIKPLARLKSEEEVE